MYAKIVNTQTRQVDIGDGTDVTYYKAIGMSEMDVERDNDGLWYVAGCAPKPSLEDIRMIKRTELNTAFEKASKTAFCLSSAGFEINTDETANRNIEGLVLIMKEGESTLFRAHDNTFHEVTREQLEVMRKEIARHTQNRYRTKWSLENRIHQAETVAALEAIHVNFWDRENKTRGTDKK